MHDIDLMLKLQLEGKTKQAREISDKLEALGPDKILDPEGKNTTDIWLRHCFNRGWFLLQEGKYQEACKLLESGRILKTYGGNPVKTTKPLYNPEIHNIKEKSVLINLEGGFGDEIIHARFATSYKKLGASKVYVAASPEIVSIVSRIEGVDKVILRNQYDEIDFDYWLPAFSAGWLAGHTIETIPSDPYITALPEQIKIWNNLIKTDKNKIKVGIRWAGNPKFEHQQFRKFPPEFLINLSKYKELQIYSLQKDHNVLNLPSNIIDLQHILISWEDTLAAIANLDIIITSCTSVAHMAASMGKETWVAVPILPYHIWSFGSPESNSSPYYKTAKIYRQKEAKFWNKTFQNLYTDLEQKFNLSHIDMPNEDKTFKKLNLGSGKKNLENFVNVDKFEFYNPDVVHNLNKLPWPFKDNEFDHIVAQNILQQLGETKADFIKILEEMTRISENGAIWEIEIPFFRSDNFYSDVRNKHAITLNMFHMFNKKLLFDKTNMGEEIDLFAFDTKLDFEVCDYVIEYFPKILEALNNNVINKQMLSEISATNFNVVKSLKILLQVYKPGRTDIQEIKNAIQRQFSNKSSLQ